MLSLLLGLAGWGIGPALDAAEPGGIKSPDLLLVANKGDRTLGIVDPVAGRQIAVVPEDGVTGHEVAASSDGKLAFVPIYGNSGVGQPGTDGRLLRVIDLAKRQVAGTVDFGKGVRPHCAVMGPRNGLLYVTTELQNSVAVIDPSTLSIVQTIPTDQSESHMLAITRDGRRGYTSNVGPGTVSVLDLETKRVLAVIATSGRAQRISLSVDDRWVFTADQTKAQLAMIDAVANQVRTWVPLRAWLRHGAHTRWALVAGGAARTRQVAVVDLDLLKAVRTLDVPPTPQEVLVQPDGARAYVSCDAAGQVAVIDLRNWRVEKLVPVGTAPMASPGPRRIERQFLLVRTFPFYQA